MVIDGAVEVVDTAAAVLLAVADDDDGVVGRVIGHLVQVPHTRTHQVAVKIDGIVGTVQQRLDIEVVLRLCDARLLGIALDGADVHVTAVLLVGRAVHHVFGEPFHVVTERLGIAFGVTVGDEEDVDGVIRRTALVEVHDGILLLGRLHRQMGRIQHRVFQQGGHVLAVVGGEPQPHGLFRHGDVGALLHTGDLRFAALGGAVLREEAGVAAAVDQLLRGLVEHLDEDVAVLVGLHQLRTRAVPVVHEREMVDLQLLDILVADMQIVDPQRLVNEIVVEILGLRKGEAAQEKE